MQTAPGERFAEGGIVLKGNEAANVSEAALAPVENSSDTDDVAIAEKLSNIDLTADIETLGIGGGVTDGDGSNGDGNGTGGSGTETSITAHLFGTEGNGASFVYVFDRSGSMDGSRMVTAKKELLRSINSLGSTQFFNVIFYSGRGDLVFWKPKHQLVSATPEDKKSAGQFVTAVIPAGGTRHREPLLEALRHRSDVIFFLTDGERQDDLTAAELDEICKMNRRQTQINVIQFGEGSLTDLPSEILQNLAKQNGGQYQYIKIR